MKKWLCMMVVAGMVLTVTGCGSKDEAQEPETPAVEQAETEETETAEATEEETEETEETAEEPEDDFDGVKGYNDAYGVTYLNGPDPDNLYANVEYTDYDYFIVCGYSTSSFSNNMVELKIKMMNADDYKTLEDVVNKDTIGNLAYATADSKEVTHGSVQCLEAPFMVNETDGEWLAGAFEHDGRLFMYEAQVKEDGTEEQLDELFDEVNEHIVIF